jgi:membrane protein
MPRWFVLKMSRKGKSLPIPGLQFKTRPKLFDLVRLIYREFMLNRCDVRATALSYSTVLSLVPVLGLAFTFFELFGGSQWVTTRIKPYLIDSLAIGVGDKAVETLDRLLVSISLSSLGVFGIIFLVLAGVSFLSGLEDTFNSVWKVTQGRSRLARFRNFWLMTTLIPLLILASLAATSSVHWGASFKAALPPLFYSAISGWLVPLTLEWMGFVLLFMLIPNVRTRFGPAAWGSLLGAGLWEIAKRGYLFYTSMSTSSNMLYGALIAIPLFFAWLNITYIILLVGLETAYVLQNFEEMRRFQLDPHHDFSSDGIVLNLLVDITHRQCDGADPLVVNQAAARFSFRAPEYKRLLDRLIQHTIITRPLSDSDYLRLAREPSAITLAQVYEALGGIPGSGLPEGSADYTLNLQIERQTDWQQHSLKDLATGASKSV